MKSKLFLFVLSLVLFSEAGFAQHSRDKHRDQATNTDRNSREDRQPEYGPRIRYDQDRWTVMSPKAFRLALASIRNEHFDQDRLNLARQIVRRNHLSTAQIRSIAQLFNFDSSKLAFTKYAYVTCIDPENYYALGRIFSFSSSRKELYDYIARV